MKILLSLLCVGIFLNSVFAQPLTFSEDFNDNKNGWSTSKNDQSSSAIESGYYVIEHKRDKKNWNYWCKVNNFSASKDFVIETKLRLDKGSDD